jgi:hypothetical protein
MRKVPSTNTPEGRKALLERAEREARREKRRLIFFSVMLALLVIAYVASNLQQGKQADRQAELVGTDEPEFVETVAVEPFDMTLVADQIRDDTLEERVLVKAAAIDPVADYVDGKNDAYFHALGRRDLDGDARAALAAAPGEHRGEVYRVRGRLEEIKSRDLPDGRRQYRGWLRGEDGEVTHFATMGVPDEVIYGDWMRLDGLFVQLHRVEDHDGVWAEGPLLVGASLVTSYAGFAPDEITSDALRRELDAIVDDTARSSTGLDGRVFDAQWRLLAFIRSEAYGEIDWERDAVELTNETMAAILKDGASWRYRLAGQPDPRLAPGPDGERPALAEDLIPVPIRLPISRNMGINTISPGENPSRIEEITEGWIGNTTWTNQAGVLYFVLPESRPDLSDMNEARLLTGKGFFLKNHNYESKDLGTRTAPFFVFSELEVYEPQPSFLAQHILWVVVGITLLLVTLFPVLLMRDRKRSLQLQQDLARRRQARRRKAAEARQA